MSGAAVIGSLEPRITEYLVEGRYEVARPPSNAL